MTRRVWAILLVGALHVARARSVRETGLFSWKSLSTDLMLASLGVSIAGVWQWNPYLVPLTIAPFVLISRSFALLELLHRSERRFRAIYESTLETTAGGVKTFDLGGSATTTEFTGAVIDKIRTKVEIWSSLGSAV